MAVTCPSSITSLPVRAGSTSLRGTGHTKAAGRERLVVTVTARGRECWLDLTGALDGDSAIALESQFEQLVGGEFDQVVLDVDGLQCLDDAGATLLGRLGQLLTDQGTTVLVAEHRPALVSWPPHPIP